MDKNRIKTLNIRILAMCFDDSSRQREKIVHGGKKFVSDTEMFEISRVFLSRQVRNKQGTEELFEILINLSSRVHCMRPEASLSKNMVPQTFLKGTVK